MSKSVELNYRPDIDGLRSIAVLAVLVFHFFPKELKGGFTGVDVFFVISGYLVTSILYQNIASKKFSFTQFYLKRIKRLFPSLILVFISAYIIGWFLLLGNEFAQLGKHIFSSSLFSTNFVLYSESGYFDKSSDLKPLLHIWSLCIEEQFYLVWPLIIFLFGRFNRIFLALVMLSIAWTSWKLNLHFSSSNQALSFYWLPTRLWELAAGGIIIFVDQVKTELKSLLRKFNFGQSFLSVLTSTALSGYGLYLLVHSFHFLDQSKNLPADFAIKPVLGTVFIILAGPKSLLNKLLSNKIFVYVGLISYPLYLWHWPLISFAHIFVVDTISKPIRGILLALSFFFAILTYEFLEKKIKNKPLTKNIFQPIIGSFVIISLIGALTWKFEGLKFRYPAIEKTRKTASAFKPFEQNFNNQCKDKFLDIEMCAISNPEKSPTVLLMGDSHANHLYPGLKNYFDHRGENLLLLARSGISPFYHVRNLGNPSPKANLEDVFEFIKSNNNIHTVVISSFWGNYYEEDGIQVGDILYKNTIEDILDSKETVQKKIFKKAFIRTIQFLEDLKKKVVVIYDIPALPFHLERCLPRPFKLSPAFCDFRIQLETDKQFGYRSVIAEIVNQKQNIQAYDLLPSICPNDICTIKNQDVILYSDDFHLSIEGSKKILSEL